MHKLARKHGETRGLEGVALAYEAVSKLEFLRACPPICGKVYFSGCWSGEASRLAAAYRSIS